MEYLRAAAAEFGIEFTARALAKPRGSA